MHPVLTYALCGCFSFDLSLWRQEPRPVTQVIQIDRSNISILHKRVDLTWILNYHVLWLICSIEPKVYNNVNPMSRKCGLVVMKWSSCVCYLHKIERRSTLRKKWILVSTESLESFGGYWLVWKRDTAYSDSGKGCDSITRQKSHPQGTLKMMCSLRTKKISFSLRLTHCFPWPCLSG